MWTASDKTFKEKLAQVAREAELIAAMSHLLKQDEMEDTGDETYEGYCDEMKDGARSLLNAVNDKKPEAARKAAGAIGQACDRCHDDYRG